LSLAWQSERAIKSCWLNRNQGKSVTVSPALIWRASIDLPQEVWRKMARFEISQLTEVAHIDGGRTSDSLFELGLVYATGRDGDVDLVSAHKWFNLAAMRGNEIAKRYRKEISIEMSRREIARAQREAREWLASH